MQTLSNELKSIIGRRLEAASSREVLAIASALCAPDEVNAVRSEPPAPYSIEERVRFQIIGAAGDEVRDNTTGLIWTRNHIGDGRMSWADAKKACESLRWGGASWRLPTVKELLTLVDYERTEPAIDPIFKCEPAAYWTDTSLESSPSDGAWGVPFYDGYSYYGHQGRECFVRAVRSSQ